MRRSTRDFALRLAVVAGLGVALRALYLLTLARDTVGIGDWWFYHWQANDLAAGLGFVEPFRLRLEGLELPSAGHPPLYPLVLAGISWVFDGVGPLAHRALGLGFGAATIVLVGLLGRRAGGPRIGLVAAGICAAYPAMIGVDGALMSETLYGALIAGALLAAWTLLDRPSPGLAAGLGVLLGLAALTRSEALALVPLLAWPVAWRAGRDGRWLRMAATAAACALVVAPWTIRNLVAFDALVPISTNDSTVLAGANCPITYAGENLGGWDIRCISRRQEDNEARQAAIWRDEGLEHAREHAGRLPVVLVVRLLRVWDLWQPRRQVLFAEGRHIRMQQAAVAAWFLLVPLAAAGALALRRRGRPLVILLVPFLMVCLSTLVGYGAPRLRHAAEIPLVVLAAAGALAVLDAWRARRAAAPRPFAAA